MNDKIETLRPIYNKKTQIIHMPFERKLLKVVKEGNEQVVEFMNSLPRDRMQIRVFNSDEWTENEHITITGKGLIYECKVVNVKKNRKVIIKKVAEASKPANLTPEEIEIIKEL